MKKQLTKNEFKLVRVILFQTIENNSDVVKVRIKNEHVRIVSVLSEEKKILI